MGWLKPSLRSRWEDYSRTDGRVKLLLMDEQTKSTGKVYLVGAGPGDPRLITLRGVQCLSRADVVLYDYLVNPAILEHAPPEAELVCLGSHRSGRVLSQDEINAAMVAAAQAGRTVVRLKGGDPDIFARSAEEMEALAAWASISRPCPALRPPWPPPAMPVSRLPTPSTPRHWPWSRGMSDRTRSSPRSTTPRWPIFPAR